MAIALITGSAGLIGSEAAAYFAEQGLDVVGIDNDLRRVFFGDEASTAWNRQRLQQQLGHRYRHADLDIRDVDALNRLLGECGDAVELVIHTAAQPSHDWAAKEPHTDFGVNAVGTLNLLEAVRRYCPLAVFLFTSTNKVYGDTPNRLPLVEQETRWEIEADHHFAGGISEEMTVDQSLHSLFGASKLAADVLVQEYGRYFDLRTACFRGGCLTGPNHSGTQLHGFLAYLMLCTVTGAPYTVYGYQGKQVRDNIHSYDLVRAFDAVFRASRDGRGKAPRGEVYNIGGGRFSNCSMREGIELCQQITGRQLRHGYAEDNRVGDHIWWISDNGKFERHYPDWRLTFDVPAILRQIYEHNAERWHAERGRSERQQSEALPQPEGGAA